jgi:hypothetical protein
LLATALFIAPSVHAKPIMKATKIEDLSHKSKYRFSMTTERTRHKGSKFAMVTAVKAAVGAIAKPIADVSNTRKSQRTKW